MAYTDNPLNPIDRMRLRIGDIDPDFPLVNDQWYQYYVQQGYTEGAVALEIAQKILAQYAIEGSRQREGAVEVYGKEKFESYLAWLKEITTSPTSSVVAPPVPYAGGISKQDMYDNDSNTDNVRPWRPYNHEDYGF